MFQTDGWPARRTRLMNAFHARMAARLQVSPRFVSPPEPRTIGSFARGRQLAAGTLQFAGLLVEAPGAMLWDIPQTDPAFRAESQGFGWLDDLAAVSDAPTRSCAQAWTYGWITRYGNGSGPGWTPDLAARRLTRWINHAKLLMHGQDSVAVDRYFRSLAQQTQFLARRWAAAEPGLPRFEALTGLIHAGLALTGMEGYVAPAIAALAGECVAQIDAQGGVPTRSPEDLLEVFTLLTRTASALGEAGRMAHRDHFAAIERIAPTLRALRHADGGLARFQGGGRGAEGRLDHALANSGVRASRATGLAMGYARLSAGRTSVIVDAAAPPKGGASAHAHASTLAFELTSGRRPVVVSCGSGAPFGLEWQRAGRATASHSTLAIEGYSSSRFGAPRPAAPGCADLLTDAPRIVNAQQAQGAEGTTLIVGHDGYVATHGLTHVRRMGLSFDGRALAGEDTLGVMTEADRAVFDRLMTRAKVQGVRYKLRFHLHPDVDAALDMGGTAVSMALKSGEIWVFRAQGDVALTLEPSVYLEKTRLKPRASKQIVLSATVIDYASQISWSLAKAQDTPMGIRDLEPGGGLGE